MVKLQLHQLLENPLINHRLFRQHAHAHNRSCVRFQIFSDARPFYDALRGQGFAHGFSVLSERAVFTYKCDNLYNPSLEGGIRLDDPDLNIDWMIPEEKRIISEKDTKHPFFKDVITNF